MRAAFLSALALLLLTPSLTYEPPERFFVNYPGGGGICVRDAGVYTFDFEYVGSYSESPLTNPTVTYEYLVTRYQNNTASVIINITAERSAPSNYSYGPIRRTETGPVLFILEGYLSTPDGWRDGYSWGMFC